LYLFARHNDEGQNMPEISTETTITEVLQYISLHATTEDIDRIYDVCKLRSKAHRVSRAAQVKVGQTIKIVKITPKALQGLIGEVVSHDGKHASVRLDAESTVTLRYSRTRYATVIPASTDQYLMTGIPLACCEVQD
jgi:hypothetical protein